MKTSHLLKNPTSLILTQLELSVEPCQLALEVNSKFLQKKKTSNFHEYLGEELLFPKQSKKKKTIFLKWTLWFYRSYGMRNCNFFKLMFKKINSRSYDYYLTVFFLNMSKIT